jgi:hypothetical protein
MPSNASRQQAVCRASRGTIPWLRRQLTLTRLAAFLDEAAKFSIVFVVVQYCYESPDRERSQESAMWQVVNSARGQTGSGGRSLALKWVRLSPRPARTRWSSRCRAWSPPGWVVHPFDVVEDVGARRLARGVVLAMTPLDLQGSEEALHHRVVPHVAGASSCSGSGAIG